MSNHITIIDKMVGTNNHGFCVRVGKENPMNRLASCLGWGVTEATYTSFQDAYQAALEYRNRVCPDWTIRADCTLAV